MKTRQTLFAPSDWRAIAGLCIPPLLSIVVMLLYNMADMYFVGWMGKVSAVAAVSLAGPVYSLLMAVSTMLGNGACTRIAQERGAHLLVLHMLLGPFVGAYYLSAVHQG